MQTLNPMEQMLGDMLGIVIEEAVTKALQPLLDRMTVQEQQLQEYLDIINAFKAKGTVLSKLLGA